MEESEWDEEKKEKVLALIMLAGEVMLSNGAETYRIEETMRRMAESQGFQAIEAFVIPTGIFATIGHSEIGASTMIKRVKSRTIHLEKVAKVNKLSREMFSHQIDVDSAYQMLLEIRSLPPYSRLISSIGISMSCFCFSYMFGGTWLDCLNALITGLILSQWMHVSSRKNVSRVLTNIFGGAMISLSALLIINGGIGDNIDKVVIGAIMPLVPGVALTNAIRDILEGDFLSGSARIIDALIVAICIAAGVSSVFHLWIIVFGGLVL